MNRFASFINILGTRVATALNYTVLGTTEAEYEPIQGVLLDDTGKYLADESGNHLSYAEETTVTDYLIAAADSRFVDDAGNQIYLLE